MGSWARGLRVTPISTGWDEYLGKTTKTEKESPNKKKKKKENDNHGASSRTERTGSALGDGSPPAGARREPGMLGTRNPLFVKRRHDVLVVQGDHWWGVARRTAKPVALHSAGATMSGSHLTGPARCTNHRQPLVPWEPMRRGAGVKQAVASGPFCHGRTNPLSPASGTRWSGTMRRTAPRKGRVGRNVDRWPSVAMGMWNAIHWRVMSPQGLLRGLHPQLPSGHKGQRQISDMVLSMGLVSARKGRQCEACEACEACEETPCSGIFPPISRIFYDSASLGGGCGCD